MPQHPGMPFKSVDPDAWEARRSLSEVTAEVRKAQTAETWKDADGDAGMFDLYSRLFEKYMGKRFQARSKLNVVRFMVAARVYCEEHKLDLALYVSAQMVSLRKWSTTTKFGFQPNMLMGNDALGRYNRFVRQLSRRFRHAAEDSMSSADKALREALFSDEFSIGAVMAAEAVNGKLVDIVAAVQSVVPSVAWRAVALGMKAGDAPGRKLHLDLLRNHGKPWMESALSLARLEAACAVADRYAPALSDRIGIGQSGFSWGHFAKLIGVMYAREEASKFTPRPEFGEKIYA